MMRILLSIYILLLYGERTHATTPEPYLRFKMAVDRLAFESDIGKHAASLQVLKAIALGIPQRLPADVESALSLPAGELRLAEYSDSSVRERALIRIGESGLPGRLAFLRSLVKTDFQPDPTGSLWPAARIGLRSAELFALTGPNSRVNFLEQTIEASKGLSSEAIWASNKLCNEGAVGSVAKIATVYQWRPTEAMDRMRDCEARMEIVRRDPNRTKALASVLTTLPSKDREFTRWAIFELLEIRTGQAQIALADFAREIDRLPNSHPDKYWFSEIRGMVLHLLSLRHAAK